MKHHTLDTRAGTFIYRSLYSYEQISIPFSFLLEFSTLLVPLIYRTKDGHGYHGDRRSWRRSKNLEASSDTRATNITASLQDLVLHPNDCNRQTKYYLPETTSLNSLENPTFL